VTDFGTIFDKWNWTNLYYGIL